MATSSLTKLTVPLASDQSNPTQGLLMPKLKYRFRVTFLNLGTSQPTTELTKQVMDFTRPNVTFENIDLPIYNSTIRLAGKHSWQDITCKVRDDAGGNVSRLVDEQLQKQLAIASTLIASMKKRKRRSAKRKTILSSSSRRMRATSSKRR